MHNFKKTLENYWGEIESEEFLKYYLNEGEKQKIDELLNEFNNEEIMENPEEIIRRIHTDFSIVGPIVLEWFVRSKLFNSRVYGFVFEYLTNLNISKVDKAEEGSRQTNAWASGQPACLDELLFNLIPEEFEEKKIGKEIGDFADRLSLFINFGDPNYDEENVKENRGRSLIEWPTVFPRLLFNLKKQGEEQNWPKWLNISSGQIEEGALDKFLIGDPQLWLCKLPKLRFKEKLINNKIDWLCKN
uniref:Uncharacterized protein n=1 Tax=Meloidogyne enterolobii TaxID=390850 RepID=A0A6V7XA78_MELEN|nr:unnamed protein product [Meloidogyne enterolobii]